jgi:hypothetical protein
VLELGFPPGRLLLPGGLAHPRVVTPAATHEATGQPGVATPAFGTSLLNPAPPPKQNRSLLAIVLVTVSLGWAVYSGVTGGDQAGRLQYDRRAADA